MSRAALVLASIVAAIAGLVAGGYLSARVYTVNVVLEGQATDDASSVLDDITVLKQLRWGGQEADAFQHLERRLHEDLDRLEPHKGDPHADRARDRALQYLVKYRPYPSARQP